MSILGGWLIAPSLLAIGCVTLGLLVERATGRRAPGALVPALGLATMIAVAGIATTWDATSELAVPLVALLCIAGAVVARPCRDPRLRAAWPWPVVVAAGAFAVYALPSLWSGQGSITGYVKLDDSATWLLLTQHVFEHGRDLSGVAPSSVSATLDAWLGSGYPTGSFMPLGVASAASGQDPANAYAPTIAVAAAVLALGLFTCVRESGVAPARAAVCALVGVQASLFLGYAQWGGIKEAVAAALLPPLAVFAVRGDAVATAVTAGALLNVLGLNGLAWAGPALVLGAVVVRRPARVGAGAAVLVAAALPALLEVRFLRQTTEGAITAAGDLGNLRKPLSPLQAAGLWPAGDFRGDPDPRWLGVMLAVLVLAAAALALGAALRGRRWPLPALACVALPGAVAAVAVGAPWVDAKALAIVAPVVLTLAATLAARRRAALAVLALLVAWSSLLVARDVYVAPRDQLAELRELAPEVTGHAPTLVLDPEVYASRYFLRDGQPEGASDLRVRRVGLRGGGTAERLTTVDVDAVATGDLWAYESIVRRRSPAGSRPPAAYQRVRAGEFFEVWRRAPGARRPIARLPLGDSLERAAVPRCRSVAALAAAGGGARILAASPSARPIVVPLETAAIPPPWRTAGGARPVTDGTAAARVRIPAAGRWRVWVGGSSLGRLEVRVGGRRLGVRRHELGHGAGWQRFGSAALPAGEAEITLRYSRGHRAGRGARGDEPRLGPVAFTPVTEDAAAPVVEVPARQYRRLCGRRAYDWIEALP